MPIAIFQQYQVLCRFLGPWTKAPPLLTGLPIWAFTGIYHLIRWASQQTRAPNIGQPLRPFFSVVLTTWSRFKFCLVRYYIAPTLSHVDTLILLAWNVPWPSLPPSLFNLSVPLEVWTMTLPGGSSTYSIPALSALSLSSRTLWT